MPASVSPHDHRPRQPRREVVARAARRRLDARGVRELPGVHQRRARAGAPPARRHLRRAQHGARRARPHAHVESARHRRRRAICGASQIERARAAFAALARGRRARDRHAPQSAQGRALAPPRPRAHAARARRLRRPRRRPRPLRPRPPGSDPLRGAHEARHRGLHRGHGEQPVARRAPEFGERASRSPTARSWCTRASGRRSSGASSTAPCTASRDERRRPPDRTPARRGAARRRRAPPPPAHARPPRHRAPPPHLESHRHGELPRARTARAPRLPRRAARGARRDRAAGAGTHASAARGRAPRRSWRTGSRSSSPARGALAPPAPLSERDALLVAKLELHHRRLNELHFGGALREIEIRLSDKMRTRLGHYVRRDAGRARRTSPSAAATSAARLGRRPRHAAARDGPPVAGRDRRLKVDHGRHFKAKARAVGLAEYRSPAPSAETTNTRFPLALQSLFLWR